MLGKCKHWLEHSYAQTERWILNTMIGALSFKIWLLDYIAGLLAMSADRTFLGPFRAGRFIIAIL